MGFQRIRSAATYLKLSFLNSSFRTTQAVWYVVLIAWSIYLWTYIIRVDIDPMSLTLLVTVSVGLFYSLLVDRDQFLLCKQLHNDTVFQIDESRITNLINDLTHQSRKWQSICAVVWLLIFAAGYILAEYRFGKFFVINLVCSVLIGLRFGRSVANGGTARVVRSYLIGFQMLVTHPDRAGGLALIGNFYLKQASIVLVPILWTLAWIMLISNQVIPQYTYDRWLPLLWCSLIVSTVGIIASFWIPLSSLQSYIVEWKRKEEPYVTELRRKLRDLKSRTFPNAARRDHITALTLYVHSFTYMSNWCLSPPVRTAIFSALVMLSVSSSISVLLTII